LSQRRPRKRGHDKIPVFTLAESPVVLGAASKRQSESG
jgi:hypothetical protein